MKQVASIPDLMLSLKAALEAGRRAKINAIVATLIERGAPIGSQWRVITSIMMNNGEYSLAKRAAELFVESQGNAVTARLELGIMLHQAGRLAEARDIIQSLPENVPDTAGHAYILGTLESKLGNIEVARAHLLKACEAAPQNGHNWLALAMTDAASQDSALSARILAVRSIVERGAETDRAPYFYAAGKVLADLGRHDEAFAAFSEGARSLATQRRFSADADDRHTERLLTEFDADSIRSIGQRVEIDTSRPIIVTGHPRSGTTLVEQILTSHSAVSDGDELGLMRILARDIGGPYPQMLKGYLGRGARSNDLSALYLHLLDERFGTSGRVVDKTLNASRYLGMLAALLPDAPIVWMRRNALDCAWSCFRNYFTRDMAWTLSLPDIGRFFANEDRLLDHWCRVLGDRLLVLDYEELVGDPQTHIPRLLDHCGLAHEPGVFEPHKTERAVTTASVVQVREPINTRAIGGADRYRDHLRPFIDTYTALGGKID